MGIKHFSTLDIPLDVSDNKSVLGFDNIKEVADTLNNIPTKYVTDTPVVAKKKDMKLVGILRKKRDTTNVVIDMEKPKDKFSMRGTSTCDTTGTTKVTNSNVVFPTSSVGIL